MKKKRRQKRNLNWFLRVFTLGAAVRGLYPAVVEGAEKLPQTPFIALVGPHKSAKETFVVPAFLWRWEFAILVKASAFKRFGSIFKRPMMKAGLIPVERQAGRSHESFPFAVGALAEGRNLMLYSEGTRHPFDPYVHRARPGVIFMALKAGVPIVPIGLIGMVDTPRTDKKAGRRIVIGDPIDVKHELGLLGYAVIGTAVESIAARRVMHRLMEKVAELAETTYVGRDGRDSEEA